MSLHVYTDRKDIPNDMLVVDDNDVFFNSHTVLNNSDFEQMVLKNIDQATYVSPRSFGTSSIFVYKFKDIQPPICYSAFKC